MKIQFTIRREHRVRSRTVEEVTVNAVACRIAHGEHERRLGVFSLLATILKVVNRVEHLEEQCGDTNGMSRRARSRFAVTWVGNM